MKKSNEDEVLNAGEEDQMTISGYRRSYPKFILTYIGALLSCGLLLIAISWRRRIFMRCTHNRCPLDKAEKVLLIDSYNQQFVERVERPIEKTVSTSKQYTYFVNKKIKYVWDAQRAKFQKVGGLEVRSCAQFYALAEGLHSTEAIFRLQYYGRNSIYVEVKPICSLILSEIRSPFYIYQIFIVIIWMVQIYYQFALCIVFLSVLSITATVWETRKQSKALRDAVRTDAIVTVLRDGREVQKPSDDLVPGDVILLPQNNFTMICDAVLLTGNCVVNESMLTEQQLCEGSELLLTFSGMVSEEENLFPVIIIIGESTPITKVPVANDPNEGYDPTTHKRSTLFSGTEILNSRSMDGESVKAVVFNTGFATAKGELVRAILFPKPVNFKLYSDLLKCIIMFFVVGIPPVIYSTIVWIQLDAYVKDVVIIVLDVLTFLVPPVLPAVLTSINAHAQRRLRKEGIYCLNSRYINFCGALDVVCFDKTGTLTEDSLDLSGAVPVDRGKFERAVKDVSVLPNGPLVRALATCHSLTKVEGKMLGHTLDVKIFEAIGWDLEEPQFGDDVPFEKLPPRIVFPRMSHHPDEVNSAIKARMQVHERASCDSSGPKGDDFRNIVRLAAFLVALEVAFSDEVQVTQRFVTHLDFTWGHKPASAIAVVRQFPFESLLRRMSVVAKTQGNEHFDVYLKGAPELVASLSRSETIPEDFKDILEFYTRQGFRVIAVGTRKLSPELTWDDVLRMPREELECQLTFRGLVVLQNRLKPETVPSLNILKEADIRTIMVTGDNLLTAITVARDCGMIEECDSVISVEANLVTPDDAVMSKPRLEIHYNYAKLPGFSEKLNMMQNGMVDDICVPAQTQGRYHIAMEGVTFNLIRLHDAQLLDKVVLKGTIFARMLPEHKLYLIETLQNLGHQVGMCGDGANDCGALKTAHAGVSLSVAEASVASPFTSTKQNIKCIPTVIKEGRATLSATFGAFRYMVCYCFVLLAAVLMMFWDGQKPSDGGYVMIDIILNLIPPIVFGSTQAYPGLVKRPPTRSIISFLPQFSMFSFMLIQIGVYVIAYEYCLMQPWYEPFVYVREETHFPAASDSGTAILTVNMMSYVIAAVIFSPGPPYRKAFHTNKLYVTIVIAEFILVSYMTIYPDEGIARFVNLKPSPNIEYRLVLYTLSLGNFILSYVWEIFFIQGFLFEYVVPAIRRLRGPIHKYEKMHKKLDADDKWPPVGRYEVASVRDDLSGDESDAASSRQSNSRKTQWRRRSSESSQKVALKLAKSGDPANDESPPEALSFVTFKDGRHKLADDNDGQDFV